MEGNRLNITQNCKRVILFSMGKNRLLVVVAHRHTMQLSVHVHTVPRGCSRDYFLLMTLKQKFLSYIGSTISSTLKFL